MLRSTKVALGVVAVVVVAAAVLGISRWPNDVVAAAGLLEVAVLSIAALFARGQVLEARHLRDAQSQPYVVVSVQPSRLAGILLELVIENMGKTVAREVRFQFDPPLEPESQFKIADWAAVKKGIPTLVPGQRLSTLWESAIALYAANSTAPKEYNVTVTYFGEERQAEPYSYRYLLDLGIFDAGTGVGEIGLEGAAKALIEINRTLERWTHQSDGVKAYTVDAAEDDARRNERIQQMVARARSKPESQAKTEKGEPGEDQAASDAQIEPQS